MKIEIKPGILAYIVQSPIQENNEAVVEVVKRVVTGDYYDGRRLLSEEGDRDWVVKTNHKGLRVLLVDKNGEFLRFDIAAWTVVQEKNLKPISGLDLSEEEDVYSDKPLELDKVEEDTYV